MSILRKHNKYDNSTIIITSDHTWRRDPDLTFADTERWTHVPLFIKFAGQNRRVDVEQPFRATFLAELLDSVRSGKVSLEDLNELVRDEKMYYALEPSDNRNWKPLQK